MKSSFPPESPKQCPCGHKHFSWTIGEEEVYCWDCNRKYPVEDCFGPDTSTPSEVTEEEPQD